MGLKLTFTVVAVACILALALSLTGRWQLIGLAQTAKPRCDCWFPQDKKYGLKDNKGGCRIKDCEPPKAPPRVSTAEGAGGEGSCQPIK